MSRYAVIFAILLTTVEFPAVAQVDCPFPDSAAVADSISPTAYLPLTVGNEWHYELHSGGLVSDITIREVLKDTLIEGISFAKLRELSYDLDPFHREESFSYVSVTDASTYRYDRLANSVEPDPIQLASAYNACYPIAGGLAHVYVLENWTLRVTESGESVEYIAPQAKYFDLYGDDASFGAVLLPEIGFARYVGELAESNLIYAAIGGTSIGTRADSTYDVLTGRGQHWASNNDLQLLGYPNPASSFYFLSLRGSRRIARVQVQVFDVLGRKRHNLSPSDPIRMRVDVSGLESGIYFARVVADGIDVSRRFVVAN